MTAPGQTLQLCLRARDGLDIAIDARDAGSPRPRVHLFHCVREEKPPRLDLLNGDDRLARWAHHSQLTVERSFLGTSRVRPVSIPVYEEGRHLLAPSNVGIDHRRDIRQLSIDRHRPRLPSQARRFDHGLDPTVQRRVHPHEQFPNALDVVAIVTEHQDLRRAVVT